MVPTSHFLLRAARAASVAVLATFYAGTIAVAHQFAAYTEDPAVSETAPDQDRPAEVYARQLVPFHTSEAPGTIIVDTAERHLYLVQPNDLAIRYGIGVGRLGFQWSGVERVSRKEEWPDWTPPPEMVDGNPICLNSWPVVQVTPSAREPCILVTPSSASMERTSLRRSGTLCRRVAFVSMTWT